MSVVPTDQLTEWLHDTVTCLARTDLSQVEVFYRATSGLTLSRSPDAEMVVRSDFDAGLAVGARTNHPKGGRAGFVSASRADGLIDVVSGALRAAGSRSAPPELKPFPDASPQHDLPLASELRREVESAAASAKAHPADISIRHELVTTAVVNLGGDVHSWTQRRHRVWCTVGDGPRGLASPGWTGAPAEPTRLDSGRIVGDAARQAELLSGAVPCNAGPQAVLWGPGSAGVFFHEVCGHSMELDVWRRWRGQSLGDGKGTVAARELRGFDDPTLPNLWGSYPVDDQGTPAKSRAIIDCGALAEPLSGADPTLQGSGGHGRRQSYAFPAIPRLANPHISPGPNDPAELLASVRDGIYVLDARDGSFDPASGDFVVDARLGRRIRNGELAEVVGPFRLRGSAREALAAVVGVGNDLAFVTGTCRKQSQEIPVANGSPTLLVDRIEVVPI